MGRRLSEEKAGVQRTESDQVVQRSKGMTIQTPHQEGLKIEMRGVGQGQAVESQRRKLS